MERQNKGLMVIVAILAVTVLGMAVGFAALASTLNINGNTTVEPANWEVRFLNPTNDTTATSYYTDNSKLAVENSYTNAKTKDQRAADGTTKLLTTAPTITKDEVTFDAHLYEIGDKMSFDVTVVNKGDYDASLNTVDMTLDNTTTTDKSANLNYLKYTITYDGHDYVIDSTKTSPQKTTVTANSIILEAGESATLTVTVEYVKPTNSTDLPTAVQTVKGTAALNFIPKTA